MVTTRLTYQDYANLEGDERHELLDGELIPGTSPDEDHQTASLRMIVRMNAFVDENDLAGSSTLHTMSYSQTPTSSSPTCCLSRRRGTTSGLRPIYRERRTWQWRFCRPPHPDGTGTTSASCTPATVSGSTGSSIPLTASYRSSNSGTACSRSSRPAPNETLLSPWSSRASASAWRSFSRSNHLLRSPRDRLGVSPGRGSPSVHGTGCPPASPFRPDVSRTPSACVGHVL